MPHKTRTAALPALVLLCWLGISALAHAAEPAVHDVAKLFSADAVSKAESALRDIKARTGKSVVIETYRGVPADKRDAFRANRVKFYQDWVAARGRDLKLVNGALFLVCKETDADVAGGAKPGTRVEYWADAKTIKVLTPAESKAIERALGTQLASNPDKGLADAVAEARRSIDTLF